MASRANILAVRNAVLGMLVLAACSEGPVVDRCTLYEAERPIPGQLVSARIDGRRWVAASDYWAAIDTAEAHLALYGTTYHDSWQETISLSLYGFHGAGTYPIDLWTPNPLSSATYYCEYSLSGYVGSIGAPGDSVWVSAWDSVTGHLSATFSFHGLGGRDGIPVEVTEGKVDAMVTRR